MTSSTTELARAVAHADETSSSHPAACVEGAARGLALSRAAGDRLAEMQISYYAGFSHYLLSQDHEAMAAMEHALGVARELGDQRWEARVVGGLGAVHSGFGDNATAIELLEQSLELRREIGDTYGIAASLNNLGVTFEEMGLFLDRARDLLREAHSMFVEMNDHHGMCASLSHLASLDVTLSAELVAEDPAGADRLAQGAVVTARKAVAHGRAVGGNPRLVAETLVKEALALMACGRLDEAQQPLDEVAAMAGLVDTPHLAISLASGRGRLHRLRGELDEAVAALETGLRVSDGLQRTFERVHLLTELVTVHEQRGDLGAALAAHRELLTATLKQREDAAERRGRAVNAQLDLERARVAAELQRVRSEHLEVINRELAYDATHDPLTGLANRRSFDTALAARTASADSDLTCVLADLDDFKGVNDRYSHGVGDEVLRRVGRIVAAAVRGTDLVARIGGEEIAVLLAATEDGPARVDTVCERIRAAISGARWEDLAPGLTVTISIGAATRDPGEPADRLMARADTYLYAAKAGGRDRVVTRASVESGRDRLRTGAPEHPNGNRVGYRTPVDPPSAQPECLHHP
ncbi:diguanylate cyclase [Actinotalea sp. K2]|uniref:diguanylate cyclase n=1 Tax=Actinotalea sp. K2 TaxID=2939438 RepID=UPI0020174F7E|nr:diguanylate cyclase [Actinotalea sp. K2]MCL3859953.1 diguanylate cyclase [Actinotalea sp. K2]